MQHAPPSLPAQRLIPDNSLKSRSSAGGAFYFPLFNKALNLPSFDENPPKAGCPSAIVFEHSLSICRDPPLLPFLPRKKDAFSRSFAGGSSRSCNPPALARIDRETRLFCAQQIIPLAPPLHHGDPRRPFSRPSFFRKYKRFPPIVWCKQAFYSSQHKFSSNWGGQ